MSFHLYRINELYSNADGSVQFIELFVTSNGENLWLGQMLRATQGTTTHTFMFPVNLPSAATANTTVLIGTQGFANLGLVAPDFIVPDGFLFQNGGTVNFAGVDEVAHGALPTNGQSIDRNGTPGVNSPRNFSGATGTIQSNAIIGTDGADTLTGTAAANVIQALGGNDTVSGGPGNDTLDGGPGVDTVVLSGPRASYLGAARAGGLDISDQAGTDGTDFVAGFERFRFSDKGFAFDLGANQSAGSTVKVIGAAFGPAQIAAHPDYVGAGLGLFDGGMSMLEVCQLVLGTQPFLQLAGSSSNEAFVNTVYRNVVGAPPSDADRDFYAGLLQGSGGALSQAQLLEIAANADINAAHINLAGLQAGGVEYV